ncbi:MAG TPA: DegT/DnrJ/EryC1/StrS family aminotransferase [Prosthecobacter sp.]
MSELPSSAVEAAALAAAGWVRSALAPDAAAATHHWRGDGPVGELEARLRAHYSVPCALSMSSATNALLALALAYDLAGQEIILPPQSYGATYGPFAWLGCRLLLADADADGNLCPMSVRKKMTRQTRAVLATDFKGRPHDHRSIRDLCTQNHCLYITDAACTHPASMRDGRLAGSLSDAWVISFGMGKPLPAGEGAAVMTRDRGLYEKLLHLTQHPERWRREVSLSGWNASPFLNGRLHPLAAVIACVLFDQSGPRKDCRK